MDPVTIAAGISAISSLAGGGISAIGSGANNAANNANSWAMANFNAQQAQMNRDWQERMSNTAYQRAMADMRAAGLNPILAYQQGGAGTPGGAQASGQASHFDNAMEGLGQGVHSAGAAATRAIELQNVAAQTDVNKATVGLTNANTAKSVQETATNASVARNYDANTELAIQSSGNPEATRKLLNAQEFSARASGALTTTQQQQLEKYGPHWSGQIGGSIERALKAIRGTPSGNNTPIGRSPQQNQQGEPSWMPRFNPAPGPGLNIDIRR